MSYPRPPVSSRMPLPGRTHAALLAALAIGAASLFSSAPAAAQARATATATRSGHQPGDPVRAAEAMIHITEIDSPPRHLVLGAFGVDAVAGRLRGSLEEIERWRDVGVGTDFPPG